MMIKTDCLKYLVNVFLEVDYIVVTGLWIMLWSPKECVTEACLYACGV